MMEKPPKPYRSLSRRVFGWTLTFSKSQHPAMFFFGGISTWKLWPSHLVDHADHFLEFCHVTNLLPTQWGMCHEYNWINWNWNGSIPKSKKDLTIRGCVALYCGFSHGLQEFCLPTGGAKLIRHLPNPWIFGNGLLGDGDAINVL